MLLKQLELELGKFSLGGRKIKLLNSRNKSIQLRIIGRGGQGILTLGKLIGNLFFQMGNEVTLIPRYGAERRGAKIFVDLRISSQEIKDKSLLGTVSHLFVLDYGVLDLEDIKLVSDNGIIVIRDNQLRNKYKDILERDLQIFLLDETKIKNNKLNYMNELYLLILPNIFTEIKIEAIEQYFHTTYSNEPHIPKISDLSNILMREINLEDYNDV